MKSNNNKFKIIFVLFSFATFLLGLASCKKSETGAAPTITRVRLISKNDTVQATIPARVDSTGKVIDTTYTTTVILPFDSTIAGGRLNNQYAIVGTNLATTVSVSFNGLSVYFNPGLVTDKSIIITIPPDAPFGPTQNNILTVVTRYGMVDFNFPILQPPPIITSFDPAVGSAGDTVTINGTVFNGLTGVKFDTSSAVIVSSSPTQIKVLVPAGVVQSYIYVTTPGGTTQSTNSFGFKYIIYLSGLTKYWGGNQGGYSGYSSDLNFSDISHILTGTSDIAVVFSSNYGALQIGYGGASISTSTLGLTAIKFSVYGGAGTPDGTKAQVVINGDYADAVQFSIAANGYTTYTIPLSSLGNPATITEFVIQGVNVGVPSTIYVDDIGFI
jgi:hypothetical protein